MAQARGKTCFKGDNRNREQTAKTGAEQFCGEGEGRKKKWGPMEKKIRIRKNLTDKQKGKGNKQGSWGL